MGRILRYGSAGDRWPIESGDIWQIGPHILACGDLEEDHAQMLINLFGPIDFVLTDPPYNAAMATQYRRKMNDQQAVKFPDLIRKVLEVGRQASKGACIETSLSSVELYQQLLPESNVSLLKIWNIFYYHKNPASLLCCSWSERETSSRLAFCRTKNPSGLNDVDAFAWCVEYLTEPGDIIFDPCIGQGLVARICHQASRRVIGMELNPRRLAVTLDWLAQQFKGISQPRKIGTLQKIDEVERTGK